MTLKYGSLCSGYEGIGLALHELLDCEPAWFAEFAKGPSKILAHHFPAVPNLGDMTKIDWANVEPVDIITGGTPCQDLSAAGKRRGMTEGTRSNLWVQMRESIAQQRPTLVVWENVRGAFSARADSEVESEQGLLGGESDGPYLRALGRVLGDLSELGYDTEWVGVRASDVGAPHSRFRVFVVAWPSNPSGDSRRFGDGNDVHARSGTVGRESAAGGSAVGVSACVGGYGTGRAWDGWDELADADSPTADTNGGRGNQGHELAELGTEVTDRAGVAYERGSGHTPATPDTEGIGWGVRDPINERPTSGAVNVPINTGNAASGASGAPTNWGAYGPAIARWESVLGRPAPTPTVPNGKAGQHRLNPWLTEWMMGAPEGWICSPEIGLTRNEQLAACGNGVVPQQCAYALRLMFDRMPAWVRRDLRLAA